MVSLKATSRKYHGKKAETYDAIRMKQARWDLEQGTIEKWLTELKPELVLDCPVGTGRFITIYRHLKITGTGVDISEEMLELAIKKNKGGVIDLAVGEATDIQCSENEYDCAVCVRFLDLIDQDAMRQVMKELARVSKRWIICTIRFGETYLPKSNTAEHDEKSFWKMVKKLGFQARDSVKFREGSWHILLLERSKENGQKISKAGTATVDFT